MPIESACLKPRRGETQLHESANDSSAPFCLAIALCSLSRVKLVLALQPVVTPDPLLPVSGGVGRRTDFAEGR